jgi:hypothetical protein
MDIAFFEWCERTLIGEVVRTSVWLFPVIEAAHLLGLSLLGGAVLLLDLRLTGLLRSSVPIPELARLTWRWTMIGIGAMIATGVPLFLSEAVKCYYNPSFWVKMGTLPIAVIFAVTVRRRVAGRAETGPSTRTRLVGAASMMLWLVVAAAGRWIGFSS